MSENKQVALINQEQFTALIADMPRVLTENQYSASKCEDVFKLLQNRASVAMSDELDTEMLSFLQAAKKTTPKMMEKRKGGTQMMDEIKSVFTGLEKRVNICIENAQKLRDTWANQNLIEQRKREEEADRQRNIDAEKGSVAADVEKQIRFKYTDHLATTKKHLNSTFESVSLPTIEEVNRYIGNYPANLNATEILSWNISVMPVYMSVDDLQAVKVAICDKLTANMIGHYNGEVTAHKQHLIDMLPSKRSELEAMANADKEEKKRLEEAAAKRKQEADEQAAKDKQKADREAEEKAIAAKSAAQINADFAALKTTSDSDVAKGKEMFEITVLHPQGYADMFALWFAKEGGKLTGEKLEKMTLGRIRGYFETVANADGEKIESQYLKYTSSYKTSTR